MVDAYLRYVFFTRQSVELLVSESKLTDKAHLSSVNKLIRVKNDLCINQFPDNDSYMSEK